MKTFYVNIFSLYSSLKDETPSQTDNVIFSNMADLLNSFQIKTKTGKEFTRQNIRIIIERTS